MEFFLKKNRRTHLNDSKEKRDWKERLETKEGEVGNREYREITDTSSFLGS